MNTTITRGSAAVLVLALLIAGCGGSDDQETRDTAAPSAPAQTAAEVTTIAAATATSAAAVATPSGPQVIEITAGEEGGSFYVTPKDVTVRPGAVTIKLTNAGPERRHNIAVRTKSGHGDLAKTATVAAGESATVEFTLTEEGTYETYCSVPGHADRGAKGTLTVQRS